MPNDLLHQIANRYPSFHGNDVWKEAVDLAYALPVHRGDGDEAPGAVMTRLRNALKGEVIAFHKQLDVRPLDDTRKRWHIGVPLTLFPKRDQGFTRVECAVEFAAADASGTFRVIDASPIDRNETLAEGGIGAELQVEASAKAGAPLPLPMTSTVASAGAKIYGKANIGYSVQRAAVVSEVLGGNGALWRLENPRRPDTLSAEGHQLAVTIEIDGAPKLSAAGYVKAYSEVQWLASSVDNFIANLGEAFTKFVKAGAPVEAYGEWQDILRAS